MGLPGSMQRGGGYHKRFDMIMVHVFRSKRGVGGSVRYPREGPRFQQQAQDIKNITNSQLYRQV